MKKLLLNLYFWPVFIITTIIGITLLPAILTINLLFLGRSPARALRIAIRFYGWVLVCLIPFMAPVRVIGNICTIPKPSIIVANHNSAIDPYLFGAIAIENCFVTSWPFKIPVYGQFMKLAGYINITDGWKSIRKQCTSMLKEGSSITIWPEGHRSRDGQIGRFKKGAFQLAVETGFPIQPVCIIGSAAIMSPGEILLNPGRVKLILLDPLAPNTNRESQHSSISTLRAQTFEAIQKCLREHQDHNHTPAPQHKNKSSNSSTSFNQRPHDAC